MPVVIGEVEVVPTDQRGTSSSTNAPASSADEALPDEIALQRALQALHEQTLRNWSH